MKNKVTIMIYSQIARYSHIVTYTVMLQLQDLKSMRNIQWSCRYEVAIVLYKVTVRYNHIVIKFYLWDLKG